MALIRCPECSREISGQATACPHCGYPITAPVQTEDLAPAPTARTEQQGKQNAEVAVKSRTVNALKVVGGLAFWAVVLVVAGRLLAGRGREEADTRTSAPPATARFVVIDSLSDENCSNIGDYCIQIHCTYQNQSAAAGERWVFATLTAERNNQIIAKHRSRLTLLPGGVQRVSFPFPEAELDQGPTRYRCGVDSEG